MAETRDMTQHRGGDKQDESLAELLKDLSQQTTTLILQEFELAKAELSAKGKRAGIGAGLFGGAGVIALFGVGALCAAAIAALAIALSVWLSALIVAAVLLTAAGGLALVGKGQLERGAPPVPTQAIESTKEDVAWLKTQAQSAKP